MIHWLILHAGLTSANSPWYLFWSGIGADWTRLMVVGGILHSVVQRKQHHEEIKDLHERHHRESVNGRK